MHRFVTIAVSWALLALALGVAAATAATAAGPADGPALATMALRADDFAAARVTAQGEVESEGAVAAYARDFAPGARPRRSSLLGASNEVALLADETAARTDLASLRRMLASASGRAAMGRAFRNGFTQSSKLAVTSLVVSRASSLGVGVDSLRFAITFKTRLGRFHVVLAFVRVDRAVGQILLLGRPGKIIAAGDVKRLGAAQRDRLRAGFTITRGQVPVTGTPTVGSTLQADHRGKGLWDGGPSEFSYGWSRCDAAGACTPIPGAINETYTVTPEDAGQTLKVSVTGRNAVSSLTVDSAPTAAVT